ncbi:Morphogenesis-related protein MSB1 [Escovopsis weberi]|uniref:Morphogenesis-related protein MSB1 n=1 Tax=Escovopsis weberi TaxID=150374 RepID=A0A0M9VTT2_ESCWE|nr:Morphogenesis-related protein MSB1 [Escovopsis weberi]
MPGLFSRLKAKDFDFRSKKKNAINDLIDAMPPVPKWDDAYTRKTVEPEEIQELLSRSTEELKFRGLDQPLLLLPFRPDSNPTAVRTFIRGFFNPNGKHLSGEALVQDLRLTDPMVIAGVVKWCWSRLQGGVVGWDAYELFKVGEFDSNMARDSFKTFIPLSVENRARQQIIFDFFSLITAVAAHSKTNGFGGRKLSRMAAWWAFEHKETGEGFDGGYSSWLNAADATSHLFFAYLRSLSPEQKPTGIELLPRSLQKLMQETEYPPQRPELLMSKIKKVVMIVDAVSPTPFALLRRANHFQYREDDRELHAFSQYDDPVQALTEECRRVLKAISSANQSHMASLKDPKGTGDASWSRFEDLGFASLEEDEDTSNGFLSSKPKKTEQQQQQQEQQQNQQQPPQSPKQQDGLLASPASLAGDMGRPTTPSWADFLSSGFIDDSQDRASLVLPPEKVLPPINTQSGRHSSQSHRPKPADQPLEPGELASIRVVDLDDAFWWVWMNSLSPEETPERKAAFGRCAVIETQISYGHWLVMEEIIAGAAPEAQEDAYIAEKKSFFSWTKRAKTISRRKSTSRKLLEKSPTAPLPSTAPAATTNTAGSRSSVGPEAHARIQAKAAQLRKDQAQLQQQQLSPTARLRSNSDLMADRRVSVAVQASEVSSALKWVKTYDKDKDHSTSGSNKDTHLSNTTAGRGSPLSPSPTPTESVYSTANSTKDQVDRKPSIAVSTPPTPPADRKDSVVSSLAAPTAPSSRPVSSKDLTTNTAPGIQDRWAQIRKNAADKTPSRKSEDLLRPKLKAMMGDDETSEETIESRVARIKARVAVLTGTMDETTAPQGTVRR